MMVMMELILVKVIVDGGCEIMFLDEKGGGVYEVEFFWSLDKEFSKVSKFYGEKVKEMLVKEVEFIKEIEVNLIKSLGLGMEEEMILFVFGIVFFMEGIFFYIYVGGKYSK